MNTSLSSRVTAQPGDSVLDPLDLVTLFSFSLSAAVSTLLMANNKKFWHEAERPCINQYQQSNGDRDSTRKTFIETHAVLEA